MDTLQKRVRRIAIYGVLALMAAIVAGYMTGIWQSADNFIQDHVLMSPRTVDTKIILIGIDDRSLEEIGRWPWERKKIAVLVDKVSKGNPKAIGLDILFSEPSPELQDDILLTGALRRAGNVVLPVAGRFDRQTVRTQDGLMAKEVIRPIPMLEASAAIAHINVVPDPSDGVVRRLEPRIVQNGNRFVSFAEAMYMTGIEGIKNGFLGEFITSEAKSAPYIDFVGYAGAYGVLSAADVLSGRIAPAYFKDAYVIIGPTAIGLLEDSYMTPLNRQKPMNGIEIHANALQCLMEGRYKHETGLLTDLVSILIMMAVAMLVTWRIKGWYSFPIIMIQMGIYILIAITAYDRGSRMILLEPLIGTLIVYLFMQGVHYLETWLEKKQIVGLFGKYVAPEVVGEILKMGEAALKTEGQRRDVTVMFVDVRGFTPLSEKTSPEIVVKVLNAYLSLTSKAIFSERGTLDKFIGDATMAVFNAPLDLADHQIAAVRAALKMKEQSKGLADRLKADYDVDLHFGIGINTGPAVIGNIGSEERLDYTAIGDTVNTAARLESRAKADEILISEPVKERIQYMFECEPVGEMQLKGKEVAIPVFRVVGLKNDSNGGVA